MTEPCQVWSVPLSAVVPCSGWLSSAGWCDAPEVHNNQLLVFILVLHNQSANIVKKKSEMSSECSGTFYRSVVCRGLSACIVEGPRNPYPCVNNIGKCCRALCQDFHFPLRQDILCGQSSHYILQDKVYLQWIKLVQRSASFAWPAAWFQTIAINVISVIFLSANSN